MSIIVSAASRKDGITFYGSKYKVFMNEKKDGEIEYKHEKIEKSVQTMDKKIHRIFLLRGLYEFFKVKLFVVTWIISAMNKIAIIAMENVEGANEEALSYAENMVNVSTALITLSLLFIVGLVLFRTMGNCKKVFAYHGAEHKVIHALDSDLGLTLENVRDQRRYDRYCGSMLAIFVVLLSIISFLFIPYAMFFYPVIYAIGWEIFCINNAENLPVLKWMYKLGNIIQEKVITKEPSDEMILASIEAVKILSELESQE